MKRPEAPDMHKIYSLRNLSDMAYDWEEYIEALEDYCDELEERIQEMQGGVQ